jgi:hypothetical protein
MLYGVGYEAFRDSKKGAAGAKLGKINQPIGFQDQYPNIST